MWVESAGPGTGSTFHFTIQAHAGQLPEGGDARRRHVIGEQPALKGKRAAGRRRQRHQPAHPGAAGRPSGAWWPSTPTRRRRRCRCCSSERFDLAILDMHMPGMDGVQLATRIREAGHHAAAGAVHARSAGRRTCSGLFAAYLAKPLHQSQLFDTLVTLLSGERAARAPRPSAAKPKLDAGMAAAPPAAHPAGRGQRGQPEAGAAPAAADGLPRRRGRQRHRGHRMRRAPALRRGADGRADARDGRAGGQRAASPRAGRPASARASSP